MKILVTDGVTLQSNNDLPLDCLYSFGEVIIFDNIQYDELLEQVKDVDIILCNKTEIDRKVMESAPNLKYIGIFATGYNNIDIKCAKEKDIVVCNAGSYSTNAVAQQVIAYILNHYTKITQYDAFVKQGGWQNSAVFSPLIYTTDEVYGKTIGLIGYGNIAKAVEKAVVALGMNVLVYTRTVIENDKKFVPLDYLLQNSDVISVHCPLNEQSRDMFNEQTFNRCKDGAFFINTARGGVMDEKALFDALTSGKLSGAAIDVLKSEPMNKDCPLINAKNIIITPHTSWAPLATRERLLKIVCQNIDAFLNGTPQNNVVK